MPDPTPDPTSAAADAPEVRGTRPRAKAGRPPVRKKTYLVERPSGTVEVAEGYAFRIRDGSQAERIADGRLEIWQDGKPTIWPAGSWTRLQQVE